MEATEQVLQSLARQGIDALQRGELGGARRAFDELLASGRGTAQTWLLLAETCFQQPDNVRAHEALDEVLKLDARNPFALLMKGDLYRRSGDDQAAIPYYRWGLSAVHSGCS